MSPAIAADHADPAVVVTDDFEHKRQEMQRVAKDCVVVVDNLPKIGSDKYERLVSRLTPRFEVAALRRNEAGEPRVTFVRDEEGSTLGFAFAEYLTPEDAHRAVGLLHNLQLDRNHTFWAITAGDLEQLQEMPVEFVPPPAIPVTTKDRPDFRSWLLDERGRDQFMIRHDDKASIYWHDHAVKPQLDYSKVKWTESAAVWSPMGTYVATFHIRGIQIWGRLPQEKSEDKVEWVRVMRFEHNNVSLVDFSPCENYLVTFNGTEPERDDKRNPRALVVWDIHTGKRKRGFLGPPRTMVGEDGSIPWPIFQWSHNDTYFARLNENAISVYQTPDMGLLDKKSIKVPYIQHFSWSPTDDIIAFWTPEVNDSPARVTLIDLPSRVELRQKALFSVSEIVLHWHEEGKFLCCKVDRLTKSKKGQFTNFELFRVKAKDIPVEVLEYKEKDEVMAFAWEPCGNRFAVIHGYTEQAGRSDVSFFTMEGISGELKPLFTLEKKNSNSLHWSPKGRFILLAAIATQNGALEFYDVNDAQTCKTEPKPIGDVEHFLCNDVQWDPSGRFVATSVTYWRNRTENGYVIWTLYGKELARVNVDMLYQFSWRPRPPSKLDAKQEKNVKKTLRDRRDRYEREDKDLKDSVSSGRAAHRKQLRDAYHVFLKEAKERWAEETAARRETRCGIASDDEGDLETIVETKETVISVAATIDWNVKLLSEEDERD